MTEKQSGQAMLVTMLFMSGLILVGTAVAGLLVSYQIRQAADTQASTQAILAADAGIENAFYCYRHEFHPGSGADLNAERGSGGCKETGKLFGNFGGRDGVEYTTRLQWKGDVLAPSGFIVVSEGRAGKTRRVLESVFEIKS
ncbi:MAG: pilus assembly PilX N-terminal domain-containing protein [bacterium]|nr:pilus assembly PilX N-terminal domain-containing protein [bacterium]